MLPASTVVEELHIYLHAIKFCSMWQIFFPYTVFDHFQLCIVKTTLGITGFGKGLLYLELPVKVNKTLGSHSNNYEDYSLLGCDTMYFSMFQHFKKMYCSHVQVDENVSLLY
jgi:hypothetical protein